MVDFYGMPAGLIFFRKHLVHYLRPYSIPTEHRQALLTCEDKAVFDRHLDSLQDYLSEVPA
jgi:hypothetical protein